MNHETIYAPSPSTPPSLHFPPHPIHNLGRSLRLPPPAFPLWRAMAFPVLYAVRRLCSYRPHV